MLNNETKILQRIALGEDSTLELKSVEFDGSKILGPHRTSVADELAAIANTTTGVLILGVNDKTKIIEGIPFDKLDLVETWLHSICNDIINPPLDCIIKKITLTVDEEPKHLIVVDVPKSLFVHRSPNGYFRRVGSAKREMAPDALARLFQQRSQARLVRFDEQAVPNTGVEDLVPRLWQRFRSPLSAQDDLSFLKKLNLITEDESGRIRATVSGVLMATENPEEYLSNAFIQAVYYKSTERNAKYQLDAKDITGPLDIQIKEACKFVESNMKVYATKAPYRIDFPQYSMSAVFEAITNAVAHRDYSIYGSKIRLQIFSDRLEIFSPGTIPNTMTIENITERQAARNELISSLLAKCPMNVDAYGSKRRHIMDKRGEGVPIIITESIELSEKRPLYQLLDDAELKLTIYATPCPHKD